MLLQRACALARTFFQGQNKDDFGPLWLHLYPQSPRTQLVRSYCGSIVCHLVICENVFDVYDLNLVGFPKSPIDSLPTKLAVHYRLG